MRSGPRLCGRGPQKFPALTLSPSQYFCCGGHARLWRKAGLVHPFASQCFMCCATDDRAWSVACSLRRKTHCRIGLACCERDIEIVVRSSDASAFVGRHNFISCEHFMFICWAQVRPTDGCHYDLNMVPNIAPGVCQLFVVIAIHARRPCASGVCFLKFHLHTRLPRQGGGGPRFCGRDRDCVKAVRKSFPP